MIAFQSRLHGTDVHATDRIVCTNLQNVHATLQQAACDHDAGTSTGSILAANIATAGAGVGNSGFLATDSEMNQLYAVRKHSGAAKGSQPFSGRVMLKRMSQKIHQAKFTFWRSALTQRQVLCESCHAT